MHAVRREFALRLDDVLSRRLHLTTETDDGGDAALESVAALMAQELRWTPDFTGEEVVRARDAMLAGSLWRGLS